MAKKCLPVGILNEGVGATDACEALALVSLPEEPLEHLPADPAPRPLPRRLLVLPREGVVHRELVPVLRGELLQLLPPHDVGGGLVKEAEGDAPTAVGWLCYAAKVFE